MLIPATSLLHGPRVRVLHDEAGNGVTTLIGQDQPFQMLTYFSRTIREQFAADHPHLVGPSWSIFRYGPLHVVQPPPYISLVRGDRLALIDLMEWMARCCQRDTVVGLRLVIECPVRYLLAMHSIETLGINLLADEVPMVVYRIGYEMFDVDVVSRVFSAGENLLPEIADALCLCIARYFFHASLPEVDQ
jgi:hypothetical protein